MPKQINYIRFKLFFCFNTVKVLNKILTYYSISGMTVWRSGRPEVAGSNLVSPIHTLLNCLSPFLLSWPRWFELSSLKLCLQEYQKKSFFINIQYLRHREYKNPGRGWHLHFKLPSYSTDTGNAGKNWWGAKVFSIAVSEEHRYDIGIRTAGGRLAGSRHWRPTVYGIIYDESADRNDNVLEKLS